MECKKRWMYLSKKYKKLRSMENSFIKIPINENISTYFNNTMNENNFDVAINGVQVRASLIVIKKLLGIHHD